MMTELTEGFVKGSLSLSREYLDDSTAFLDQGRVRSSIDRAYYSMHHGAVALLAHRGLKPPKSHRGLVSMFGLELVGRGVIEKEFGRMLTGSLRDRTSSTYSPQADVTAQTAEDAVADAKRFYAAVTALLNR